MQTSLGDKLKKKKHFDDYKTVIFYFFYFCLKAPGRNYNKVTNYNPTVVE